MKVYQAAAITLATCFLLTMLAAVMNCEEDSISEVSGSGAILEMASGHIFKVDDVDQVDSALWLGAEDVLVCDQTVTVKGQTVHLYKVINKEEDGEEVEATRLR